MKQYLDLMAKIVNEGVRQENRTGIDTFSIFGAQMRFDLRDGFPILTTKKVNLRAIIHELLWFIRGETNTQYLTDNNVHIWDAWQDDEGNLGPVYGEQLRRIKSYQSIKPKIFEPAPIDGATIESFSTSGVRNLGERSVFGVGWYGAYDAFDPHYSMLVNIWRDMLRRCYSKESKSYAHYGAHGVHVSEAWQCFAVFQREVKKIPGWTLKLEYPTEYSLDKDVLWASNRYGRDTCMWASAAMQNANRSNTKYFKAVSPTGEEILWTSIGEMHRQEGVNLSAVHRCLNGKLHTHHGWTDFQYVEVPDGEVLRYSEVDQLKSMIASIKHDPTSRRHVMTLWNPAQLDRMALTTCHGTTIQFYVNTGNNTLSCSMYQRSVDTFLGLGFNITSYALLLTMVAQVTGYTPGELVWIGGDCHLYLNHLIQATTQIARKPFPLPAISINPTIKNIDDFVISDFEILDYRSHPAIKAEVAV